MTYFCFFSSFKSYLVSARISFRSKTRVVVTVLGFGLGQRERIWSVLGLGLTRVYPLSGQCLDLVLVKDNGYLVSVRI
jgi:hypothetical protein